MTDGRANLCIYDVAKDHRRTLLDKTYRQIYWGFDWSPDGKWICFKGVLPDGGAEIAAVSVGREERIQDRSCRARRRPRSTPPVPTMAWGGTGNQILISMQTKTDRVQQLYIFDFAGGKPPRLFPGHPADWVSSDMAWSPDGKKAVFSAVQPSPPTKRDQRSE